LNRSNIEAKDLKILMKHRLYSMFSSLNAFIKLKFSPIVKDISYSRISFSLFSLLYSLSLIFIFSPNKTDRQNSSLLKRTNIK
jgi:hypothetical protein